MTCSAVLHLSLQQEEAFQHGCYNRLAYSHSLQLCVLILCWEPVYAAVDLVVQSESSIMSVSSVGII